MSTPAENKRTIGDTPARMTRSNVNSSGAAQFPNHGITTTDWQVARLSCCDCCASVMHSEIVGRQLSGLSKEKVDGRRDDLDIGGRFGK